MAQNKSVNENGVVKRRNRIPLSCESCRLRKYARTYLGEQKLTKFRLKCDRQKPCQNCKARDMQSSCAYAADDKAGKGAPLASSSGDMSERIQKLEALVNSLARAPTGSNGDPQGGLGDDANGYPSLESALQPSAPYGAMVPTTEGHHFIGETHWEAVLRDVRDRD